MADRNFFHFAGYFYNWKCCKIKDNWNKCCQACKDQSFSKKIDSTGTDKAADKHERKTAKKRPF